ncbi:MAG: CRTAC1 family protein [Gammaproteobacteria bacterium]|nr:CRTAC1 family protein [Gammaproteobacteria bacterium]
MTEQQSDIERLRSAVRLSAIVAVAVVALAAIVVLIARYEPVSDAPNEAPVKKSVMPEAPLAMPTWRFVDVTERAGIDFLHENGARGDRFLPETMGGGVALFDFDLDNDLDLLFVNSKSWPHDKTDTTDAARTSLFRNDGSMKFTDVTSTHLDVVGYGIAPAIGDINGDGYPDLFITTVGSNRLLINHQGKKFVEATTKYDVAGDATAFSTCATFLDFDRDGDLDLFVCNYVDWSPEIDRSVDFRLTGVGRAYGPPTDFPGSTSWLYRNDGDVFTDVTDKAGVTVRNAQTGEPSGKALAVSVLDINNDGWQDLFIANDTVRNFLFINQKDGTFHEEGVTYGIAFDPSGSATGAMGLDVANYQNDTNLGIAIGNFANEMSSFYVGEAGSSVFSDDAIVVGIGASTRKVLTFGLFFFDVDLDGRLDLFNVNGHIEPKIATVQASQSYRQTPQLFWNCGRNCVRPFQLADTGNTAFGQASVARGAVAGDLDRDGDLDVVITNVGAKPSVVRNDVPTTHRWLAVALHYQGANLYAIGARVDLISSVGMQTQYITRTRSYLSQFEPIAHFGLGENTAIHNIKVTWPNGEVQFIDEVETNAYKRINYPKSAVKNE